MISYPVGPTVVGWENQFVPVIPVSTDGLGGKWQTVGLNFWEIFGPSTGVYPKETLDAFSNKDYGASRPCLLKTFGYNRLISSKTRHVIRPTIYATQFYGRSRQCGHPVRARCSLGLGRNPLINGLFQHTLKINFLFVKKNAVIPFDETKLFPLDLKSPCCLKICFFLNKKIGITFSIGDPPAKPAKPKKTSSPWKFIEVTHSWRSSRGRRSGVIIILLKLFFRQNSWSCPQAYLSTALCPRATVLSPKNAFLETNTSL